VGASKRESPDDRDRSRRAGRQAGALVALGAPISPAIARRFRLGTFGLPFPEIFLRRNFAPLTIPVGYRYPGPHRARAS
jgi:hypothetical protein